MKRLSLAMFSDATLANSTQCHSVLGINSIRCSLLSVIFFATASCATYREMENETVGYRVEGNRLRSELERLEARTEALLRDRAFLQSKMADLQNRGGSRSEIDQVRRDIGRVDGELETIRAAKRAYQ